MQQGAQHTVFHHLSADGGHALVVKGPGVSSQHGIVHHGNAGGGDGLAHLVCQQRKTLLCGLAGKQGEEAVQQAGSGVLFQQNGIFAGGHIGGAELAPGVVGSRPGAAVQIKDLRPTAEGEAILHLSALGENRIGVAQGDALFPAGSQTQCVGDIGPAGGKGHLIACHAGGSGIGGQRLTLQLHGQIDALGVAHIGKGTFRPDNGGILRRALHGVDIGALAGTGVVHGPRHQRFGLLQQLGIGVAVFALQTHPEREPQTAADAVAVDLLLHDLHRKFRALLGIDLGGVTSFFQRARHQRVAICFISHIIRHLPCRQR